MKSKTRTHLPEQQSLALSREAHWEQFPREMRDRCRDLVVQLLVSLVHSQPPRGDDDNER